MVFCFVYNGMFSDSDDFVGFEFVIFFECGKCDIVYNIRLVILLFFFLMC